MLAFVVTLTILLLFSGSAVAQIGAPGCFTAPWGWVWPSLILLFFFAFVRAERLLSQTFNSLNQNACTVAAYLLSTCNMGCECSSPCVQEEKWRLISCMYVAWTINPLQQGYHYSGPSGIDDGNLCLCNTVVYSLLSACDACQSETWITYVFIVSFSSHARYASAIRWSEYSFNCTQTLPPSR